MWGELQVRAGGDGENAGRPAIEADTKYTEERSLHGKGFKSKHDF